MKSKGLLSAGAGKKDTSAPPKKGAYIDVQKKAIGKFGKSKKGR